MKRIALLILFQVSILTLSGQEVDSIFDIRDGQTYKTVKIGEQWWMEENLRYIPHVSRVDSVGGIWVNGYNGTDVESAKATANFNTYGCLYSYYEALSVCPSGWILPRDEDWKELEISLGMPDSIADLAGYRGTNEAVKLKSTSGWNDNGNGTNESGFTALPGGFRSGVGFKVPGDEGIWWTSDESSVTLAWARELYTAYDNVMRGKADKEMGVSVRCLRETIISIKDMNHSPVSELTFTENSVVRTIIIYNRSSLGDTLKIPLINTNSSAFLFNHTSAVIPPGDSLYLVIRYDVCNFGNQMGDTLHIHCNDTYKPLINIPLWASIARPDPQICILTVNPETERIDIVWEKSPGSGIASYNVYRETAIFDQYEFIASIPYGELSVYEDMESDPAIKQQRYKISATDTCGNESERSPYHSQLFLTVLDTTGGVTLKWTEYSVEDRDINFISYKIYRGTDSTNLSELTEVSSSIISYFDNDPEVRKTTHYYRIAGVLNNACYPDADLKAGGEPYGFALSNLVDNKIPYGGTSLVDPSGLYAHQCNKENYLLLQGYSTQGLKKFNIYRSAQSPANDIYDALSASDYNDTIMIDHVNYGETYYYRVTAVDSNDVETGFSNEVIVQSEKAVDLGLHFDLCENDQIRLDAGSGFNSYQWSVQDSSDRYLTVIAAGKYWVEVEDDHGCISYDTININGISAPQINLGPDNKICEGDILVLRAGKGYLSYLWSTGATSDTIIVSEPGTYSVYVSSGGNCDGYDEIEISRLQTYQDEEICMVSLSQTWKNMVVWEKTYNQGIASYNIYRVQTIDTILLTNQPFDKLSIYVDQTSEPELGPYMYLLSVIDSCGNESNYSKKHITVHFRANPRVTEGIDLSWSKYEGFPVYYYEIYRGSEKNDLQLYTTSSAELFSKTDLSPPPGLVYYQVAAVKADPCFPTGALKSEDAYDKAFSNIDDNGGTGIGKNELSNKSLVIVPNPFTDRAIIKFSNPEQHPYQLKIIDITGKVIRMINNIGDDTIEIYRGDLSSGFYLIKLVGPRIYQGKLIIK